LLLVSTPGWPRQRLACFQRVELAAGESREVTLTIDPRLVAHFDKRGWVQAKGRYGFALGDNAEALRPSVTVALPARRFKP
jgi:beta-glucosidase